MIIIEQIHLYTLSEQYLGFINCQGIIPNKGDIVKVGDNIFEVNKREITYNDILPSLK